MFSDVLRRLIEESSMNAVTLSKELGVPKTLLYEWRAGVRMPSAENLKRLSRYFGVSVGALLEEEQEEPTRELSVLFRQASRLSPQDQRALVQAVRENLVGYLGGEEEI